MSEVLALKYRPKKLSDMIGQEVPVQTLTHSFESNSLHHAYLFVGQIGSGKTTTARIVAAMENCTETPGQNPCGQCDVCKPVFKGVHTDIMEIDGASGAGNVAQVRELKKEALYNPVDGAVTKYYIIDECHRVSDSGLDALLKILEEPPKNTRFILCTTEIQKVRPAIISRCQRHDFVKIFWMQISEYLLEVSKQAIISTT